MRKILKYKIMNILYKNKEINSKKEKYSSEKSENEYPLKFKLLKEITTDSFSSFFLDNSFCIFKSIDGILCLIYSNKNNSIISYNLDSNKKLNEIKNAHNKHISNIRYYLDKNKKVDLIISISSRENIKIWNFNNLECLLDINKVNKVGRLLSAYIINDNDVNYLLTSNSNHPEEAEPIKLYDFKGVKIKEVKDSEDNTFFVNTYYEKKSSKIYIITGNFGYAKSYDYKEDKVYKKYDSDDKRRHYSLIINENENMVKLIDSSCDGNIRIWNFDTGDLLNKINVDENQIYSICLWNNNYLLAGCMDETIQLIDLVKGKIIYELNGHNNMVICVKKIIHETYGECLISQGLKNDQIKLWTIAN